jgi:hypothetical protein
MGRLYRVEVEPEVRTWLAGLKDRDFGRVDFPSACSPSARRISASLTPVTWAGRSGNCDSTCWPSKHESPTGSRPGQVVVLLTTFRKTRSAETAEVARVLHAQKICEAEHGPAHDTFDREVT